jgi:hypothetical protein
MSRKGGEAESDPAVLAQHIEHTRHDMTETLDAIQQRLEPEQVTEYIKDVAHYVILEVKDAVRDLAGQASGALREAKAQKQDEPASRSRSSAPSGQQGWTDEKAKPIQGRSTGQMQEKAGHVTGMMQEKTGQVTSQMKEKAETMQRQSQGLWQMLKSNPIAMGAFGVAVGGLAAAIVPATAQENQLMGETRDSVLGSVQEVAGKTIDNVKSVAADAGNAVLEEAKSQSAMGQSGSTSRAPA